MKITLGNHLVAISCVALLSACASGPKVPSLDSAPSADLSVLMDAAGAAEKAEQKDVALRQYEEASKLYPTAFLPWLKIAQIKFEAASYGEAISAAQQAVARDERNKVAHSILAVSGLRVSTKALADLRHQNELTGTVRNEAQDLAKVLRESLGERVLVPAASTPATAAAAARTAPTVVVRPRAAVPPKAAASAPAAVGTGSSSPFGALK